MTIERRKKNIVKFEMFDKKIQTKQDSENLLKESLKREGEKERKVDVKLSPQKLSLKTRSQSSPKTPKFAPTKVQKKSRLTSQNSSKIQLKEHSKTKSKERKNVDPLNFNSIKKYFEVISSPGNPNITEYTRVPNINNKFDSQFVHQMGDKSATKLEKVLGS